MAGDPAFGAELRRLRLEAGLSLTELAARVHYSKGYLSKVETGVAKPNRKLAGLCDTELGSGSTLAGLVPFPVAPGTALSTLPPVTAQFVGRSAEIAEIEAALEKPVFGGPSVCVVHGMAGVGKTALAIRAAHRIQGGFADGTLFLDLRGHTPGATPVSAGATLDRFLRLLGVRGEQIPGDTDDRAALFRDRTRGRELLLVLDNARSAEQVRLLVPAEPACRVLVTSRHQLAALDEAHHVALDLPSPAEAIALFRAVCPRDGASPEIDSVVERCGRLPLAVRIAAAKLRTRPSWRVTDLNRRLADEPARLAVLDDGERDVAGAFRLSCEDLPAPQRRLLVLLTLFPGTEIGHWAAAALAGAEVEGALEHLLATHLLSELDGRYRMHDLLRTFVRAQADAELPAADRDAALNRLLDAGLFAAMRADRFVAPQRFRPEFAVDPEPPTPEIHDEAAAVAWLREEWPNLVALCLLAGERGFHAHCWRLAFALRGYFFLAKLWDPWIETCRRAADSARADGDGWAEATTLNNLGTAFSDRGELDEAAESYRRALVLYQRLDDQHGVHTGLSNLAWVEHYRGDHEAALRGLLAAREFYERTGNQRNAAITTRGIAIVETALADYASALRNTGDALVTFERLGLDMDAAMTLNARAHIHHLAGRLPEATAAYLAARDRSLECGSTYEAARAETGLGNVAASDARGADADEHWRRAADLHPALDPLMVPEAETRRTLDAR
ncbi:ATP-binding protein [Amycolatopsis lurida]